MQSGFQAKKMNTCGKLELEFAANRGKPENQAELVPGRDPDKQKNFKIFIQKIKSGTLLVQHVKGQPDSSTYVQEKGGVTFDTNRGTPCISPPSTLQGKCKLQFQGI